MASDAIAIVGMACRFPGAENVGEFWDNLCHGRESVRTFTEREISCMGVSQELASHPRFVPVSGHLEGIEKFDAAFFGIPPREAEIMDPQHRLFLETAWTALEDAGYDPRRIPGPVGVFGGCSPNKYFLYHLFNRRTGALVDHNWEGMDLPVGTNPDALTSRVSYKLGFDGPSITVQTACSSSLVAVALACDSLRDFRCEAALAGGVSVILPSHTGYLAEQGGMMSASGMCRPFDAAADGSVFGSGVGVIVVKRLDDALRDGDHIYTLIRGWAVKNDGSRRAGYTAPGVEGQAAVVVEAQLAAGVHANQITYVETHGSATPVGDPIEISALTRAFSRSPSREHRCAIGSVKSNVGHLDAAAGIAGLIKTALALQHKTIPASLHFKRSNRDIDFDATPFFVNNHTCAWESATPRLAGVSSFGLGGTSAHMILEESTTNVMCRTSDTGQTFELLPVSAHTPTALETSISNIRQFISSHPGSLSDAAYTLAVGRAELRWRAALVVATRSSAPLDIKELEATLVRSAKMSPSPPKIAFMFSGIGDQFCGIHAVLFRAKTVFRDELLRCDAAFRSSLGIDIKEILYGANTDSSRSATEPDLRKLLRRGQTSVSEIERTVIAHSVCFALEYALARQLISWGIEPAAMIGYSIGEYVAATIAGVFSVEDALAIVAARAHAVEELPKGAMMAVPLGEEELRPILHEVHLAAINGSTMCIVSGTHEALGRLRATLATKDIVAPFIRASHPFHSERMGPAAGRLVELLKTVELSEPRIPYISNVTARWITAEEATSPEYWGDHLCKTVRFSDGLRLMLPKVDVALEVGPGHSLCSYAREISVANGLNVHIHPTSGTYYAETSGSTILTAVARCWVEGMPIRWGEMYRDQTTSARQRVSLPAYPFERQRHWIDRIGSQMQLQNGSSGVCSGGNVTDVPDVACNNTALTEATGSHCRPDLGTPFVAPATETEENIAGIWRELFGYDRIGIQDDFIALGGNSLLAIRFAGLVAKRYGVVFDVAHFLEQPTIASLSQSLQAQATASEDA